MIPPELTGPEFAPRHFFRQRTARQLNPYQVERQIYELQLKRRGIKPVRVATDLRISRNAGADDSQFSPATSQADGSSQLSRVTATTAMTATTATPTTATATAAAATTPRAESDVYALTPDAGALHRRLEPKRRRITESEAADSLAPATPTTPATPATPTTPTTPRAGPVSDSDESLPSSSELELELERFKRRVRGVLPPSFLTLELANQQRPRPTPTRRAAADDVVRKGVARRKLGGSRLRDAVSTNFLGDSESDTDTAATPHKVQTRLPATAPVVIDDDSSAAEDGHVDPMLDRTRRRASTQPRKDRRPRDRARHENRDKRPRRPRPRRPPIGVIDAFMAHTRHEPSSPPRFMRIATRTAARRRQSGRAPYAPKIFDFDDSDDGLSVNAVIEQWRAGTHAAFESAGMAYVADPAAVPPSVPPTEPGSPVRELAAATAEAEREPEKPVRRKLPPGVIAIVPSKDGHAPYRPPLQPMRPADNMVESGEYVRRPRRRQQRIDDVLAAPSRQAERTRAVSPSAESTVSTATRRSRKERRPRQLLRQTRVPDFRLQLAPVVEEESATPRATPRVAPATPTAAPLVPAPAAAAAAPTTKHFTFLVQNYTATFDVFPLREGTRLAASTFVGRGGLAGALSTAKRPRLAPVEPRFFSFATVGRTLLWRGVSGAVLNELEASFELVLDWALAAQHGRDSTDAAGADAYGFLGFLADYVGAVVASESAETVASVAAVVRRQTARVTDLFTQFHGRLTAYSDLAFYLLAFQVVYLHQLRALTDDGPSLDREFATAGRLLVQLLLKYGIEDVCQFVRRFRHRIDLDVDRQTAGYLELWLMAIHTFDSSAALDDRRPTPPFWTALGAAVGVDVSETGATDVEEYERVWYATLAMCPLYQFSVEGRYERDRACANWGVVERVMDSLVAYARTNAAGGSSAAFVSYARACFVRCLALTLTWKWPGSKPVATKMYRLFAERALENLEADGGNDLPDFLRSRERSLEPAAADTVFHVFLKYLAALIGEHAGPDARRVLPGLIGLVTPLNGRVYPRTQEIRVAQLEALENQYALLLTLVWAAPPALRPTVGHLRDVIVLGQSHAQARILSVKAWWALVRLQLADGADLADAVDWYDALLRYSLGDMLELERPAHGVGLDELRRRRLNLRGCEGLLRDTLKFLRMVLAADDVRTPDQARQLLTRGLADVLTHGQALPERVRVEAVDVVDAVVGLCERLLAPAPAPAVQPDSVDEYADDSLEADLLEHEHAAWLRETGAVLAAAVADAVLAPYHQLLSDLIGTADAVADETVRRTIAVWARLARFLVATGYKDWSFFLEGRAAWKWFAECARKDQYARVWTAAVAPHEPHDVRLGT
ncbi:Mus7/MMS22 family-domain-containing protein [Dipodascopsis tothii]|uniref:Mus7/MMS22 family-domain-containing protein n=1 Tax=Dipodascopsis tothii TaxID=44089 RepID=UPI0034CDBA27